jgi:solute carrier family 25 (mitochondrial carnitine/acylcarnitine transporter), member 20/29
LRDIWIAGGVGGVASWIVSAPSELIKCRTQFQSGGKMDSLRVFREVWKQHGIRGLYLGGAITSVRDSVGYGFYFSSYELSRRLIDIGQTACEVNVGEMDVLVSGGIAGIITWASIYPLDVIKTRIQTQSWANGPVQRSQSRTKGTVMFAKQTLQQAGIQGFYKGLMVCSVRAFFVNAIQVISATFFVTSDMLTSSSGMHTRSL